MQAVAALPPPDVTPADRLSLTLFFAIVAHAILILGVTFAPPDRHPPESSTMDVILVQHKTEKPPEKADYLAQANQDGGGNSPEKARPTTPVPAPFAGNKAETVAVSPPVHPVRRVVAKKPEKPTREAPPPQPPAKQVLAQEKKPVPQKVVRKPAPKPRSHEKPRAKAHPAPKPEAEPAPTQSVNAATLMSRSLAMASLSAEIDHKLKAYAERPRQKWITARTHEYKYASYMDAWRLKVERVGNLNYPDEARRRRLSGSLLLDVALNPDGSINDIVLRRSSGFRVLDDAAVRIVKLAAPFAPFPKNIRKETDILHIERTWQFLSSNRLASK